jgi:hypothetical protein
MEVHGGDPHDPRTRRYMPGIQICCEGFILKDFWRHRSVPKCLVQLQRRYSLLDLGDVASKVKHLAIHQRPYNLRVRYDHEECILKALASFSNVETLTMVNQRHQLAEQVNDCSNLDFMDPVELVMWGRSGYSHNTAMPDMTKMDRLVLDDQAFAQSRLSYLVKAKLKSRWLKRSIPKVDHKIITTFDMKHALERTVGGADKVKNLT